MLRMVNHDQTQYYTAEFSWHFSRQLCISVLLIFPGESGNFSKSKVPIAWIYSSFSMALAIASTTMRVARGVNVTPSEAVYPSSFNRPDAVIKALVLM